MVSWSWPGCLEGKVVYLARKVEFVLVRADCCRFGEHYVLRRRLVESAWPQRPLQHLKVPVGFNEPIAKKGLGKLLVFRGGASSCGLVSGRRNGIGQRNSGFLQLPRPSWRSSFSVSGAKRRASVAVVAWSAAETPRATHVIQPHNGL